MSEKFLSGTKNNNKQSKSEVLVVKEVYKLRPPPPPVTGPFPVKSLDTSNYQLLPSWKNLLRPLRMQPYLTLPQSFPPQRPQRHQELLWTVSPPVILSFKRNGG